MDRSENMRRIRSKDTKPELELRRALHGAGYRYRLYSRSVPGHPDLWMRKWNTAVFVHGCFWHRHDGCPKATTPKTRAEFWTAKFEANVRRDETVRKQLEERGIRQLVIWECSLGREADIVSRVREFLESGEQFGEI